MLFHGHVVEHDMPLQQPFCLLSAQELCVLSAACTFYQMQDAQANGG